MRRQRREHFCLPAAPLAAGLSFNLFGMQDPSEMMPAVRPPLGSKAIGWL
jgi:hypothetical protein